MHGMPPDAVTQEIGKWHASSGRDWLGGENWGSIQNVRWRTGPKRIHLRKMSVSNVEGEYVLWAG